MKRKAQEPSPVKESKKFNSNEKLYTFLTEQGNLLKESNQFKARAYWKAAKAIRDHDDQISSGKQALSIKGIGKSISAKIDAFLNGDFDQQDLLPIFSKIPGVEYCILI
jgi:hypothetical protein